jgi:hypothetical protein
MGNTALVLELAIAALTHATELNQLLVTAQSQGRDVTDEELAGLRAKTIAAIDRLEVAKAPAVVSP